MKRLSWFALSSAMLTVVVVGLAARTNVVAEEEEKAKAEEREWGEEVQGLRMSIQLKDYDEKVYRPVTLSIIVKNTGEGTVPYAEPALVIDYGLTVRDSKGEEVPLTLYGKHFFNSWLKHLRALVELKPGEQKEYTLVASRYYDMTLPGEYTIRTTLRDCPLEHHENTPLISNTINVKVPE